MDVKAASLLQKLDSIVQEKLLKHGEEMMCTTFCAVCVCGVYVCMYVCMYHLSCAYSGYPQVDTGEL